ncbi:hypothetical protein M0R45_010849 [Rubus argutus]|uniref:MADS-box domain-containing protein n=1 Tax=Rubus argutus TaxID=59490 RepID=A0AAW1YAT0_RUBAR
MVNKSQTIKFGEEIKDVKKLKSLEKSIQKRKSTLKKSASELAILCGAQVCIVFLGPTGNVEVWPENPAEATSIITKYKQGTKKTKLVREANRSKTVDEKIEENNGFNDIDEFLNTLENFEENNGLEMGDDVFDQFLNILENFEENKSFDKGENIDQFVSNTLEIFGEVKGFNMGDKGLDNFHIDDDQSLNLEEINKGFEKGYEGLDNWSGGSLIDCVDERIGSIEGHPIRVCDDHDQQQFEYNNHDHVLNNGSNSEKSENHVVRVHNFDQLFQNDFLGDTFAECSGSNAQMVATPGFEVPQIDDVRGMSPWEISFPTLQYSAFEAADYSLYNSTKYENDNNMSPLLPSRNQRFGGAAKIDGF